MKTLLVDPEHKKRRLTALCGALLLVGGLVLSIAKGSVDIPLWDLVLVFVDPDINEGFYQVVMNIRLPRVLVGGLVGINLALSGAILQSVLKNPLADPGIIGISAGAGLAAMVVMILFPAYSALIPPAAFIGAICAALIIYFIAYDGGAHTLRLVLAGVALSAFLGAFMSTLTVLYSDRVQGTVNWMAGALIGKSWNHLYMVLPYSLIGLVGAIIGSRYLNILALGDDIARGLGLPVERVKFLLTLLAALLAASAVAAVGLLGFVGLIIPHITRLLIGSNNRFLIPFSAAFGAVTVIFADTIARTLFSPYELPVGIIMAFVGAPFFLYLLARGIK